MPLRTPRRRISTRTKQRYYEIKHFFRKALGSSINTDKKTTSVATNISNDCEHNISFDIDAEYNDNNECCDCGQDVQSLEEYISPIEEEENHSQIHDIITEQEEENRETAKSETKYLEQISERECKFDREVQAAIDIEQNPSHSSIELQDKDHDNKQQDFSMVIPKVKPEFSNDYYHRNHRKKIKITGRHISTNDSSRRKGREELMSSQSESAYYQNIAPKVVPLKTGYSYDAYNKIDRNKELISPYQRQILAENNKQYHGLPEEYKQKTKTKRHKSENPLGFEEERKRHRKPKLQNLKLDHDFIADIIRKQYKPTPIFERRRSDMSQFSAPVCRDRDLSGAEPTGATPDGYSCYYENYNPRNHRCVTNYHDVDLRSFSDTRPYHRKSRSRSRRRPNDIYNDSTMYDIIPVKEKSSPKLHRRHGDYEPRTHNTYHKEVPPSPRTRRPRLNLQSQYDKYNDIYMSTSSHTDQTNPQQQTWKSREQVIPETETDISSELYERQERCRNDIRTRPKIYQDEVVATSNTLLYDEEDNCKLKKAFEISTKANNTDKALKEIKDILQNFLHEIKKESTDVSFKSDEAPKILRGSVARTADNSISPTNCHKVHCNAAQCAMASPFMPPIGSSCYPVLPVCPMNCVQSGYIVPHPSFTCLTCKKSTQVQKTSTEAAESSDNKGKETEELVKEIYKFITLNPKLEHKESPRKKDVELTSRSVGSNYRPHKRDAKVGTPKVKYQSRSCEAIGSRSFLEPYSPPHASYSDTVIEKLSVQPAEDSEMSTNGLIMDPRKGPYKKISKVLQSIGIRRKKIPVKDSSAGTTDTSDLTESTPNEFRGSKQPPPFRQDMQAYMMHGIDYDPRVPPPHLHPGHRYPSPPRHSPHYSPPDSYHRHHGYGDVHNYDTRKPYHSPPMSEIYHQSLHQHPIYETEQHVPPAPHFPGYDPHYNMHPPQIPLCLKEIEVKSISTQSEKKLSFFKRFTKKPHASVILTARSGDAPQRNFSTQTSQEKPPGPKFQYWGAKKKYMNDGKLDFGNKFNPLTYGLEAHEKLAMGDIKVRNALLHRMFKKRNPFAPKNFLLKSMLGRDKGGFGEKTNFFRPKLFF